MSSWVAQGESPATVGEGAPVAIPPPPWSIPGMSAMVGDGELHGSPEGVPVCAGNSGVWEDAADDVGPDVSINTAKTGVAMARAAVESHMRRIPILIGMERALATAG